MIVPVYNEALRIKPQAFSAFAAEHVQFRFIFVDDGSTDTTASILARLVDVSPDSFQVLSLAQNQGKAEAVRQGMLLAFADPEIKIAGYFDADLSTPLTELPRLADALIAQPELMAVLGSRVKLLGKTIDRQPLRHYLGRVFATAASMTLRIPVYDTQCGAKLFRNDSCTRNLFATPFLSRWIFDVELIARLAQETGRTKAALAAMLYEHPLNEWRDIKGSKLKGHDFLRAALELVAIYRRYDAALR